MSVPSTVNILSKHRGIKTLCHHVQIEKPSEKQVVRKTERNQQERLPESLWWNGRTAGLGVHLGEDGRKALQFLVGQSFNPSDGMSLGNSMFWSDKAQSKTLKRRVFQQPARRKRLAFINSFKQYSRTKQPNKCDSYFLILPT